MAKQAELSTPVVARIRGYRPRRPGVEAVLDGADLEVVRAAVSAAGPASADEASRLLCHVSGHVAWAKQAAPASCAREWFGPELVERSAEAERQRVANASPYVADLERVARAYRPAGHPPRQRLVQQGRLAAYSGGRDGQQAQLEAVAAGMEGAEARSYRAGLALAFGAGLIGADAGAAMACDVLRLGQVTLVWVASRRAYTVVSGHWGKVLAQLAERAEGRLTSMYTSDGYQRLRLRLSRATGRPELSLERARNTWVLERLAEGVPLDVLADALGGRPSSLVAYLAPEGAPGPADEWFASPVPYAPPAGVVRALSALRPGRATAPAAPERDMDGYLGAFVPDDPAAAEAWAGGLGAAVADLVRALTTDTGRAQDLCVAFSGELAWAAGAGLPLSLDVLLRPSTVTRWAAMAPGRGLGPASVATLRSRLRALERAHSGRQGAEPRRAEPRHAEPRHAVASRSAYADSELAGFISRRAHITREADRGVFDCLWHLGLGAGASAHEAAQVRGTDVLTSPGHNLAVAVGGRVVVVRHDHVGALAAMAASAAEGHMTGLAGTRTDRVLARLRDDLGGGFDPARLRATWRARCLAEGAPVPAFARAAGTLSGVDHLCACLRPRRAGEALAWLAAPPWPATR